MKRSVYFSEYKRILYASILSMCPLLLQATISFSNKDAGFVLKPQNSRLFLSRPEDVVGWSQMSITKDLGRSPATQWIEGYTANTMIMQSGIGNPPTDLLTATSEAIRFGRRIDSNALLFLTKNNSNTLLFLTKNISNSITNNLNLNNSNSLISLIRYTSNAMLYQDRVASSAMVYATKNNSNAILMLQRSSSATALYNQRTMSNALIYGQRIASNTFLFLTKNNSNAILQSSRITSNTVLFFMRNGSNAMLYFDRVTSEALLYLARDNSNTLLFGFRTMSNAINHGLRNSSNAFLFANNNNSNAILNLMNITSNISRLAIDDSNAILRLDKRKANANLFLDAQEPLVITTDTVYDATSHFIHFSHDPNLLKISSGATLTLKNVVLKDFAPRHFDKSMGGNVVFGPGTIIQLASDPSLFSSTPMSLTNTWTFSGNGIVVLNGQNQELLLNTANAFSIAPTTTLVVENITLSGFGKNGQHQIQCADKTSSIAIANSKLILDNNYTFSSGTLLFGSDVMIQGDGKTFAYTTPQPCYFMPNAIVTFDHGLTFSYDPISGNKELLRLDNSAVLHLNGCSIHTTRTGLKLFTGTISIDNKVTMSSEALYNAESIELGGLLRVQLMSSALVDVFGKLKLD